MSRGSFWRSPSDGDDVAAARVREAGGERGRLAEVAAEADDAQRADPAPGARASCSNVSSVLPSSIAMISYGRPNCRQRRRQLAVELLDVREPRSASE